MNIRRRVHLTPMTPLEQLRAGRLGHRLTQLLVGLVLYGVAMGLLVRSGLGLDPWDVFHDGITRWVGLSFGTVVILTGFVVLLLWVPLRQWPGVGTIANVIVIGLATDATLALVSPPRELWLRWVMLLGGILLNGIAGAMYIGSQLGPGPRDGLMTGLVARSRFSVRLVRTALELAVLGIGWALGGVVGVGTVLYAVLIGPAIQFFLPILTVELERPGPRRAHEAELSSVGASADLAAEGA